jgi:hypothetical protein
MDLGLGLCQPSTAILLISVAGTLYHLLAGDGSAMIWWIMVGLFGTGIFQVLCYGGLEPVAWTLMAIPVLIVCFFLAVALFASRMRIEDIRRVPCGRCRRHHHGPCGHPCPGCGGSGCPRCVGEAFVGDLDESVYTTSVDDSRSNSMLGGWDCPRCKVNCRGSACPYCDYQASVCADCAGRGCPLCNRVQALSEY